MFGTYRLDDVEILLKDISGLIEPMPTAEREKNIQQGMHYSEMLPIEYEPSEQYMKMYDMALEKYAQKTAEAVAVVADKIWKEKGNDVVLVSLARAGISVGVLIKRYLRFKYKTNVRHYAVSIIRGRGIDDNAMKHILQRHQPQDIQFVDGWTGKGAIQNQLNQAMEAYAGIDPGLAVLADPANIASKNGTTEDFLIASSCLNSTVSGLLSRTFYRKDIIGAEDYHGAVYYDELSARDLTYGFIDEVERFFRKDVIPLATYSPAKSARTEVEEICKAYEIHDINLVKPSIGETTRVLLRRVPWKILVHSLEDQVYLGHIYQLAKEKNVEIEVYPLENYRACGLIRTIADN